MAISNSKAVELSDFLLKTNDLVIARRGLWVGVLSFVIVKRGGCAEQDQWFLEQPKTCCQTI